VACAAAVAAGLQARATFSDLVRAQTRLWNAVDARVRDEHGVPLTQLTALRVVDATESCRVRDLVDTLHITVGGASKVVDRLVAAGWAARSVNDSDRRSPLLVCTSSGEALLEASTPTIDAVLHDELVTTLSAEDLLTLHRILGRLADAPADPGTGDTP
jgi:DNA-binding MarR family transcriptional regulator